MNSDSSTTVSQLKTWMNDFVVERDWERFHSPKNLAMSLAIEAAELMEHFQWLTVDQSRELNASETAAAAEELADVLCYALAIANSMKIDLAQAIEQKLVKNRAKYPIEQFRGRYGAGDPNPTSGS